jgi:protein gp37
MFEAISKTWNPVIGCQHSCSYCWARKLVNTRLKNSEKYKDGFTPKLVGKELKRKFRNQFVFVSDMGDLFGEWVPSEWIIKVIETIKQSPAELDRILRNQDRLRNIVSFQFADLTP